MDSCAKIWKGPDKRQDKDKIYCPLDCQCVFHSFSIFFALCLASTNLTAPEQFLTSSACIQVTASSLLSSNAYCPRDARTGEVA